MSIAEKFKTIAENVQKVFNAGKKAEYDAFWDGAIPDRTYYMDSTYRFAGRCWNDETFKPPFKITMWGNCNGCFYNSRMTDIMPYVEFESYITSLSQAFQNSRVKAIPYINASNISSLASSFSSANIESIIGLTVAASTRFSGAFGGASGLKHVIFDGTIGQNGLNLQWSTLLDKESITSIINTLSATTSGLSVTLSATAVNNAFSADEWATLIATKPNWTISLV
jgi:hypothetical protein